METLETSRIRAPKFEAKVEGNYGEFVLEPLERGFGVTLGNPLRRVLLSSIPGTAVTSVYIEDAMHEFQTLPGVREDVVQIILNLKELVVKFLDPHVETVTLRLRAEGPKEVRARDLEVPSDAEIVNPDLYIATLAEGAKLVMEIRVDRGVGYVPAERHNIKDRINSIPVDALFSPVRRVAYHVEDTRLGQRTDLDKLTLRIWTDGSVTPQAALTEAVGILKEHFDYFLSEEVMGEAEAEPAAEAEAAGEEEAPERTPLAELGLPTRVLHNLQEEGIHTVEDLLALTKRDLKRVPGIGERSLEEIVEALAERGLALKEG